MYCFPQEGFNVERYLKIHDLAIPNNLPLLNHQFLHGKTTFDHSSIFSYSLTRMGKLQLLYFQS